MKDWFCISNPHDIITPGILIFPERIQFNIQKMIEVARDVNRLRPHVKTYKLPEIVRMQMAHGIHQFKCATIAEAEMCAMAGAKDVMIAYLLLGANLKRVPTLISRFPDTRFSFLFDSAEGLDQIETAAQNSGMKLDIWLDVNAGMQRTGIAPGLESKKLISRAFNHKSLKFRGLHVYDGNHRQPEFSERESTALTDYRKVESFVREISSEYQAKFDVVLGGSPTFPVHAKHHQWTLSPGTSLLWDAGYGAKFRELDFQVAAVLLTQIVSKPSPEAACLDLGHKAVGSEMPHPRVVFPHIPKYEVITHNEEHLTIENPKLKEFKPGDYLYGIPMHICPTMALHEWVNVVRDGTVVEEWEVVARKRRINV